MRSHRVLLVMASVVALAAGVRAQPGALERHPALAVQLAALDATDALAYFELGERIAAEAMTPEDVALARHLHVVAFTLDRRADAPRLGPSVCLALAELSVSARERRWLRALAGAIDPRYSEQDWGGSPRESVSPAVAHRAAQALSLVRAGYGVQARALLEDPEVVAVLRRYEPMLTTPGSGGMLLQIQRWAEQWPCGECGNDRVVVRMVNGQPTTLDCNTCLGNPGPTLTREELVSQIRLEQHLLSGINRSWSAQLLTDGGEPLLDPDPDALARRFGMDPALSVWRDGQWQDPNATAQTHETIEPVLPEPAR